MTEEAEEIEDITENASGLRPPYLAWKTFQTGIAATKTATVPNRLDSTTRPASMAGGVWRHFVAATKFFTLVSEDGKTTPAFEEFVQAFGTDQWPAAIQKHLIPAYSGIMADVPMENGTSGELDAAFRARRVDNQVLTKSVRFFLHVLTAAGVPYSPRFSMRREGSSNKTRKKKETKSPEVAGGATRTAEREPNPIIKPPEYHGMIRYPLHFRRGTTVLEGAIFIPPDATAADCAILEAQIAVIKVFVSNT